MYQSTELHLLTRECRKACVDKINKYYLINQLYALKLFIIITIIIIIPVTTFTHGIYNYVPETNPVSRVHSTAAVLYLQFVLHVMLFRP